MRRFIDLKVYKEWYDNSGKLKARYYSKDTETGKKYIIEWAYCEESTEVRFSEDGDVMFTNMNVPVRCSFWARDHKAEVLADS